jgi:tRNA (adenine22-N1)-methyltransferase
MRRPHIKLSPRFKIFVDKTLPGNPFWDLCCDHGYVGLEIFLSKKCSEVHLVDQLPHVMKKLEIFIQDKIEDSSGLFLHTAKGQNLDSLLTGTVLIAGVGGKTIQTIVQDLLNRNLLDASRLLLSPHTDMKSFEELINSSEFISKFSFTEKVPLADGGKIKTLFIFDQSSSIR